MKTTTIPKNKEHAWKLACLHKGKILTAPNRKGNIITGTISQVYLRDNKIFVSLTTDAGWYVTVEV